jgi:hypothetical protein
MSKPLYYNKEKNNYLFVEMSPFRGVNYIHITIKQFDPDEQFFYRIKGISLLEPHVDFVIEELENISKELAKINLPDVRQLSFDFKEKNEQ